MRKIDNKGSDGFGSFAFRGKDHGGTIEVDEEGYVVVAPAGSRFVKGNARNITEVRLIAGLIHIMV